MTSAAACVVLESSGVEELEEETQKNPGEHDPRGFCNPKPSQYMPPSQGVQSELVRSPGEFP
jgi:hypothetical protein